MLAALALMMTMMASPACELARYLPRIMLPKEKPAAWILAHG